MSDALEALFEEMEETADRAVRYGRVAGFMSALKTVLLASAVLAVVAYIALHDWYFAVAGGGLAVASLVADKLYRNYYREALTTVDRLKGLARMVAITSRLDQLTAETEIEEVERILKKITRN
jgi:hypothetical protein